VLFALVALQDLELEQLDVKNTFLHGELEEQIYVGVYSSRKGIKEVSLWPTIIS